MFHQLESSVQRRVAQYLKDAYQSDAPVVIEQPKQASFGELALPAAFQLAKQLKKNPKAIAADLVAGLGLLPGVSALEIAGNGYINVRFDRGAYAFGILRGAESVTGDDNAHAGKIVVEHTNINPNKAAHIGHLRNAILGDTFVRMLRESGRSVEVQNYIDNTGVQVADVVVGFHFLEHKTPEQVSGMIAQPRFDYLCWDLYARTSAYYKDHPEAVAWRAETLHAIEADEGVLAQLGHLVADAIVQRHLATMLRLGIEYDVLPRESEILHLQFWAKAFEQLKERQAIYFETQGKNAGCWVMPGSAFSETREEEDSKVIVRSNGTVTYVGKDIAYQLWKFGLLGRDFRYKQLLRYPDQRALYVSTSGEGDPEAAGFGQASQVFNVIDSRQSYLQDVVVAGLRALGYKEQAEKSIHFSYEMVALTPRTCASLGIDLPEEDRRKQYVEVSGRKGLGVKADDLIDLLIQNAEAEVESRHADAEPEVRKQVATQIATGALRYFMLKFTRNSVIAFDFQEALSFTGETGPYVQYAAVRANKILAELQTRGEALPDFASELTQDAIARQLADEELWQLLLTASQADSAVQRAIHSGEPAAVARYTFQLAQAFSNFYHGFHVLNEADREKRVFLLWMTDYFRRQLQSTLRILGIEVPPYM